MPFKHTPAATASSFDDPTLVPHAGLLPVMRHAERSGLQKLAQLWLLIPTDKGANVGAKIFALVAGMVAGADSIEDLRAFSFGHLYQLDAVASRFLTNLSQEAAGLVATVGNELVMVDVDDSIVEVHGYSLTRQL